LLRRSRSRRHDGDDPRAVLPLRAGEIAPHAHAWHLRDELIPLETIAEMSALGVFGLTVPEEFGGAGTVEDRHVRRLRGIEPRLYRRGLAWHAVGDRGRIDIGGGTKDQRAHWLPFIASGGKLPTAVFTEPNTGSDLGALTTRATRDGGVYRVFGNKTWITHAARADFMTLLARTDPSTRPSWPVDVSRRETAWNSR